MMLRRLWRLALRLTPREVRGRFTDEVLATADALDAARPRRPRALLRAVLDALIWPWAVRRDLRRAGVAGRPGRTRPRDTLGTDLRLAFRRITRERGFTSFVSTALALGIGANAALIDVADRLLLSGPDHVADVSRVVQFHAAIDTPAGRRQHNPSFGHVTYDLLRTRARTLESVATYAVNDAVRDRGEAARPIRLGYASAGFFHLLGTSPARGRFFRDRDDAPGADPVVVLADGAWQAWFGGAADVLGRTVMLNEEPHRVVGIAPRGFTGPQFGRVDAWVPMHRLSERVTPDFRIAWTAQWLQVVGRLAPGETAAAAGQEATTLFRAAYAGPRPLPTGVYLRAVGLRAADLEPGSPDVQLLVGLLAVGMVILVVACANVGNLMLARGVRRGHEVAVRMALGASRWRIVRLFLLEAAMLSAGGVLIGLPIAELAGTGLRRAVFTDIAWTGGVVDARLGTWAMALGGVVAILVGLVPAFRAAFRPPGQALASAGERVGHRRSGLQTVLTVVQVTLSTVLLLGGGLLTRSLWQIHQMDLGIDADRVMVASLSWSGLGRIPASARDAERERRRSFHLDALPALRAIPGVESASVAVGMPFGFRFRVPVRVMGIDELPRLGSDFPSTSAVGPGYFDTVGTSIVRGRAFNVSDRGGSPLVAIVNETMASAIWPGAEPLGACLLVGRDAASCTEVVGVAEDTRQSRLREPASMHYYVPAGQETAFGGSVLLIRPSGDHAAVAAAVRRRLTAADPAISSIDVESVRDRIDPQVQPWRRATVVFAGAGLLALAVAAVGLYSVVSYVVADRRREIGVRLALGARSGNIASLVLRHAIVTTVAGLGLGCMAVLVAGRFVEPLLFDTPAADPLVFLIVAALLVTGSIAAAVGPVRRAGAVDPVEILRAD